ncbi:unnamed protein product, partial [Thlaspi arvense]
MRRSIRESTPSRRVLDHVAAVHRHRRSAAPSYCHRPGIISVLLKLQASSALLIFCCWCYYVIVRAASFLFSIVVYDWCVVFSIHLAQVNVVKLRSLLPCAIPISSTENQ